MRIGCDDVTGDKMTARSLDANIAHIDGRRRLDGVISQQLEERIQRQRILKPEACIVGAIMQSRVQATRGVSASLI